MVYELFIMSKTHHFCKWLFLNFNFLQAGGKSDVVSEKAAKRLKVGIAADVAKATARSSDSTAAVASPRAEMMADKNKLVDIVLSPSQKVNTGMVLQESTSFKQQIRPLAPAGPPFLMNRYKLDNRPTAFRIIPPLPVGFADVSSSSSLSSPPPPPTPLLALMFVASVEYISVS